MSATTDRVQQPPAGRDQYPGEVEINRLGVPLRGHDEKRLRVVRVLVIEGPSAWVIRTLTGSIISPSEPLRVGRGSVVEYARDVQEVRG